MIQDQLGNITLINGDCVEYMRSLPDNAFRLGVVDPPYGSASEDCTKDGGGYNRFGGWFARYKTSRQNPQLVRKIQEIPNPQHIGDSGTKTADSSATNYPPPRKILKANSVTKWI